jgi:hypothetical protein
MFHWAHYAAWLRTLSSTRWPSEPVAAVHWRVLTCLLAEWGSTVSEPYPSSSSTSSSLDADLSWFWVFCRQFPRAWALHSHSSDDAEWCVYRMIS